MLPATDKNLRSFGWLMSGAILVVSLLLFARHPGGYRTNVFPALLGVSALFALLAFVAPRALTFVYKVWMGMARYMGMVMTTVLLTLFYFTLLVPFTLVRTKDPLRKKLGGATYWEPHKNVESTLERFARPF